MEKVVVTNNLTPIYFIEWDLAKPSWTNVYNSLFYRVSCCRENTTNQSLEDFCIVQVIRNFECSSCILAFSNTVRHFTYRWTKGRKNDRWVCRHIVMITFPIVLGWVIFISLTFLSCWFVIWNFHFEVNYLTSSSVEFPPNNASSMRDRIVAWRVTIGLLHFTKPIDASLCVEMLFQRIYAITT